MKRKLLLFMLSAALIIQMIPVSFVTASTISSIGKTTLQEFDSRLAYNGKWDSVTGDYNGGTAKFSADPTASVSFQFQGTGFQYIGEVASHNDTLDIYLDGKKQASIKPNSGKKSKQQILFELYGLSDRLHHIIIQAAPKGNSKSKNPIFNVDAIVLISNNSSQPTPTPVAPSPSPTAEPTSTPVEPSPSPTAEPTPTPVAPSPSPTAEPTPTPVAPSPSPTAEPTPTPVVPSPSPTAEPTPTPVAPSPSPTAEPTPTPVAPSPSPTAEPTPTPVAPSPSPTAEPTPTPVAPSPSPTAEPTPTPVVLSPSPTAEPTPTPVVPSPSPTAEPAPTPVVPSPSPSEQPPAAPIGLSAVVDRNNVLLTWTKVEQAIGYNIYSKTGTEDYSKIAELSDLAFFEDTRFSSIVLSGPIIIQYKITALGANGLESTGEPLDVVLEPGPVLQKLEAASRNQVVLLFDKPLNPSIAGNPSVFTLTDKISSAILPVLTAEVSADKRQVLLTTGNQISRRTYTVSAAELRGLDNQSVYLNNPVFEGYTLTFNFQQVKKNRVLNSSFELYTGNTGAADNWIKWASPGVTETAGIADRSAVSGIQAQHLSANGMSNGQMLSVYQDVPVEPNKMFLAVAHIQVKELTNSRIEFVVDFFDSTNKWLKSNKQELHTDSSDYKPIRLNDKIPATASKARIYLILRATNANAAGSALVDDVSFVYSDNQLMNPDFEQYTGTTGAADRWLKWVSTGITETTTVVSSPILSGNTAQKLQASGMATNGFVSLYQDVQLETGKVFDATAYIHAEALNNSRAELFLDFYDSTGKWLKSYKQEISALTSGYQALNVRDRAPSTATRARISIVLRAIGDQASGAVYADGVSFTYSDNMLLNAGFEQYTGTNGVSDRWVKWVTSGVTDSVSPVSDPINNGSQAQKIAGTIPNVGGITSLYQDVLVEPNKIFLATANIYAESLVNSRAEWFIDFFDSTGKWIKNYKQEITTPTAGYKKWTINDRIPANAARARIYVILRSVGTDASGVVYAGDVAFAYSDNLLVNADFEASSHTNGLADKWMKWAPGVAQDGVSLVNQPIASGNWALKIEGSGIAGNGLVSVYQDVTVESNKLFQVSGKMNMESLKGTNAELFIDYYDVTGKWIGSFKQDISDINSGYQYIDLIQRVPSTAARARVYLILRSTIEGSSGAYYADDLAFYNY